MKKEFIPYKEALALKELGFDEICLGHYYKRDNEQCLVIYGEFAPDTSKWLCTPLYQQAFRWFREKHGLDAEIMPYKFNRKEAKILGIIKGKRYVFILDDDELPELEKINFFNTYQEAEQACLIKLIEITKKKQQ